MTWKIYSNCNYIYFPCHDVKFNNNRHTHRQRHRHRQRQGTSSGRPQRGRLQRGRLHELDPPTFGCATKDTSSGKLQCGSVGRYNVVGSARRPHELDPPILGLPGVANRTLAVGGYIRELAPPNSALANRTLAAGDYGRLRCGRLRCGTLPELDPQICAWPAGY